MEDAKRALGFYWILLVGNPEPAYWDGSDWVLIGGGPIIGDLEVLGAEPIMFCDPPSE